MEKRRTTWNRRKVARMPEKFLAVERGVSQKRGNRNCP
jgi:hypothetical protein